jgi:Flp pilus assembly protein TadB
LNDTSFSIYTVRRLIKAGRYHDARTLLKETNHSQVPALDRQLDALSGDREPSRRRRAVSGCVVMALAFMVAAVVLMTASGHF